MWLTEANKGFRDPVHLTDSAAASHFHLQQQVLFAFVLTQSTQLGLQLALRFIPLADLHLLLSLLTHGVAMGGGVAAR